LHTSNKYYAGGFVIETTFSFSFFIESDAPATSKWVAGTINDSDDSLKHTVFKLGKIAIDKENNVIIELLADENEETLNFIAIHILGLLSQKHQRLPLHAAAILHQGQAILFTGLTGSGKSTCAKLLAEKGFTVLSDEMAPLYSNAGVTYLLPVCRAVHCAPINTQKQKTWSQLPNKVTEKSIPVKSIYLLQFEEGKPRIENVNSLNAIKVLQENHFKPFIKWDKESNLMRYNLCTEIIKNCTIKSFIRERNINSIEEAMNLLIKDL
jgi:hypothetical protein